MLFLLNLNACGGSGPVTDYAYVPAEGYELRVVVSASSEAQVGEWVNLRATREAGPWKRILRSQLTSESQWLPAPYEPETEVAGNLSWEVIPAGVAGFNIPSISDAGRMDRNVRFSKPGTFRLRGYTAGPTRGWSNWIEVVVR